MFLFDMIRFCITILSKMRKCYGCFLQRYCSVFDGSSRAIPLVVVSISFLMHKVQQYFSQSVIKEKKRDHYGNSRKILKGFFIKSMSDVCDCGSKIFINLYDAIISDLLSQQMPSVSSLAIVLLSAFFFKENYWSSRERRQNKRKSMQETAVLSYLFKLHSIMYVYMFVCVNH